MARYQCVLLDADGTLFDYERAESYALEKTCRELGLDYEPARDLPRYREINEEMWRAFERGEIGPDALSTTRFERFLEALGGTADPRAMSDLYLGNLAKGSFLIPGALEVVRAVSERARIAVVTNGLSRVQRSRFGGSGLAEYVGHLVISDEVGTQKPEAGIFDAALEPFQGVAKSNVLMVGDSLTSDIQGGVSYGIDTCWYNPAGLTNNEGPTPTYEIRSLDELPALV
jgi:YjjG family noncanonical pyrimidine nucleotidase